MTLFARNTAIFTALIFVLFACGLLYAARRMPVMLTESRASLQTFLRALERNDYGGANAGFSTSLSADLTPWELEKNWKKTRGKIGGLTGFESADITSPTGGRVNLWPPFVDYLLRVNGEKDSQVWAFRLKPEAGAWKIERMSELRQSDAQREYHKQHKP